MEKHKMQRSLAWVLSLVLAFGLVFNSLPMNVFAAGSPSAPQFIETDLSDRLPVELYGVTVRDVLGDKIYNECLAAFGSNAKVQYIDDYFLVDWSDGSDLVLNVAGGLDGQLDLYTAYWGALGASTGVVNVGLRIGTDLTTAGQYYTYYVDVKTLRVSDIIDFTVMVKYADGEIREVNSGVPYGLGGVIDINYEGENPLLDIGFTSLQFSLSPTDFPQDSALVGLRLGLTEAFKDATWKAFYGVYSAFDSSDPYDMKPATNVPEPSNPDHDWTGGLGGAGYGMEVYTDDAGWFAYMPNYTIAVTYKNVTQLFPIKYCFVLPNAKRLYPTLYANSGLDSICLMSSAGVEDGVEVYAYTLPADSDYVSNATYWLRLRFANSLSDDDSSMGIGLIKAAYIGKYDSEEDAKAKNAEDVKTILFSNASVSNYGEGGYRANFSGEGITITVIDTDGEVHHYKFVLDSENASAGAGQSPQAADTSFGVYGAEQQFPTGFRRHLNNLFPTRFDSDAYYYNGYQTLFFLDNWHEGLVTGSTIVPSFRSGETVSIYAGGNSGVGESVSGTRQVSGESTVELTGPVTTVQYSAAAENGLCLKNYWVSYVTLSPGGANLFVNGATNAIAAHKNPETGNPRRVVVLDAAHGHRHDITVVNTGDETLTGLTAKLSDDATGVVLATDVKSTLAPFTSMDDSYDITYQNCATSIRLIPVLGEDGKYQEGEISGTLTISSDNGGSVTMELSGIVGEFVLTTDTMRDGVKYVPYDQVVQNSNFGAATAVSYEVTGGSLPDGLELYPNGVIYGIPMEYGESTFTLAATMNSGQAALPDETVEREYAIKILDNTARNVWQATDTSGSAEDDYSLIIAIPNQDGTTGNINVGGGSAVVGDNNWSNDTLTIQSRGAYALFQDLYLDGQRLDPDSDYTSEEGSTVITIQTQTLSGQSSGQHTIAAEFYASNPTDGSLKRSAQNYTVGLSGGGSGSGSGSWSDSGYDSDSGDDSNSNVTPPIQQSPPPASRVTSDGQNIQATVKDGTAEIDSSKANISAILNGAKNGAIHIDASAYEDVTEVSVPKLMVDGALRSETVSAVSLKTNEGAVELHEGALKTISNAMTGDNDTFSLTVKIPDANTIPAAQKYPVENVLNSAVYISLSASIRHKDADGRTGSTETIHEFGGSVTVSIPYELPANMEGRKIIACHIADDGTVTYFPVKYENGVATFATTHFSIFTLVASRAAAFEDIDINARYMVSAEYVLNRGLMNGVADDQFNPGGVTTRGMVMTILARMDGVDTSGSSPWYQMGMEWAVDIGVSDGTDPNDPITREQLATMLWRYAQYKKLDVSIGEDTNILSYDDAFDISEWAVAAIQWAVGSGIINGTTDSTLSPLGNATRAEAAIMLMRFCRR